MASKKTQTLAHRLFILSKNSNPILQTFKNSTIHRAGFPPDPGDYGIFRRFLHTKADSNSPTFRPLRFGSEKLGIGIGSFRDRIDLDCLSPPTTAKKEVMMNEIRVEDMKKLVRLGEMMKVKSRLKEITKNWITFEEYIGICREVCLNRNDDDRDGVDQLAKMVDDSGFVIVLGSVVFIKPDQIAKVIAGLIPTPGMSTKDSRSNKELEEMEKQKAEIDGKAADLVRRELWWGLGFLVAQTATLMRLTFWELSWDVMEPICYYVTSTYFMGGYAFFLTTSKEPSFEGFYHSRFIAKQNHLMKLYHFDIHKYNHLRKALALDQNIRRSGDGFLLSITLL